MLVSAHVPNAMMTLRTSADTVSVTADSDHHSSTTVLHNVHSDIAVTSMANVSLVLEIMNTSTEIMDLSIKALPQTTLTLTPHVILQRSSRILSYSTMIQTALTSVDLSWETDSLCVRGLFHTAPDLSFQELSSVSKPRPGITIMHGQTMMKLVI